MYISETETELNSPIHLYTHIQCMLTTNGRPSIGSDFCWFDRDRSRFRLPSDRYQITRSVRLNKFVPIIYIEVALLIQRAGKENKYYMIAEYGMESFFARKIIQIERIRQIE